MPNVLVDLRFTKKLLKRKAVKLRQLKTVEAGKAADALQQAIDVLHRNVCALKGASGMFAIFKPKAK